MVNEQILKKIEKNEKKYYISTFGCQMNAHESEKISGILESLSYKQSEDEADADIIVINTCCIRDTAEQKIRGYLGSLKKLKTQNSNLLIVLCGCMTQQHKKAEELRRSFPFADIFLGTHNYNKLPELINERSYVKKPVIQISNYNDSEYLNDIEDTTTISRKSEAVASVNIMYGCNNFCSYCIVPYVRGRERSRKAANIISEVRDLVAQNYKEVLLLGQNVNSYFSDNISFSDLLNSIADKTGINRIRFMTSHPKDLSIEMIKSMKSHSNICNQLHLPVQSGSTKVLNEMNRGYTRDDYLKLIDRIRSEIPEITISTDIIVGFPGESTQDFKDTLSLVKEADFDSAYTFVYSPRTGTKAAQFPDRIDKITARDRIMELIDLQNKITYKKNKNLVGTVQEILVEGISTRNTDHICGRTDGGKTVNFPGSKDLVGKLINVMITQAKRTTLMGEII